MNIIFFGSDDFAATCLLELLKSHHQVKACVTGPDTRQGRGLQLALSPIKILAVEHGIGYLQPTTLKSPLAVEQLKEFDADIFVVVAYGKLLTPEVLDIPKIFCVNVHGSLLPKYRGAAPINWAILNGDAQTGVTVQKMALTLDAGDIIAQSVMTIAPDLSAEVLRTQMAEVGARLLVKTLDDIAKNAYTLKPQDPSGVTYAPKLTKDMGRIDWKRQAVDIYNQVRGLKPWPGTYTTLNGKTLKILSAEIRDSALFSSANGPENRALPLISPGQVIACDKNGFSVACGEGALYIKEVQPEAGKAMSAASYMAGHKVVPGILFS